MGSGDLDLHLEHHWGAISASRVFFDKQDGPFEAIVEPSAGGVRVTFTGWEEHPFVATAKSMRVVCRRPGVGRVELVVEAMAGGEVRILPSSNAPIRGKKVAVRLGSGDVRYVRLDYKQVNTGEHLVGLQRRSALEHVERGNEPTSPADRIAH